MADWIVGLMCPHRVYVEPFGGAASVLLQKPRVYAEIYNDLDEQIVTVFRMLRERPEDLLRVLYLTPFSREEFRQAWELALDDDLETARRVLIRASMGFGSAAATESRPNGRIMTGFRACSNRSGTTPAQDWLNVPGEMMAVVERLRGVVIENRCALKVMKQHDSVETLHYVDPPYVMETRKDRDADYRHEMTTAEHEGLLDFLLQVKGKVMLSGYECTLYTDRLKGWHVERKKTFADGAQARVECVWMNFQPPAVQGVML